MSAPIVPPTPETLAEAADILRGGGLVAMPTETVYGLAADAANPDAVARLYAAKGRPAFNPLIAHIASPDMARCEAIFCEDAGALAAMYWPGAVTLVLPVCETASVCDLARAGLETIALRHPAHTVAQELISSFGGPLVAPSANPSGQISPTRAQHVAADMGEKIDLILDGGPCKKGVESTIISFAGEAPRLLRPGAVDTQALANFLAGRLTRSNHDPLQPSAPGQLNRHYAPHASLRLNALSQMAGEALIGFGEMACTLNLSPSGNLEEAAAKLFTVLRALDARFERIAVAPIPAEGLGEAINDRLERAAKRD